MIFSRFSTISPMVSLRWIGKAGSITLMPPPSRSQALERPKPWACIVRRCSRVQPARLTVPWEKPPRWKKISTIGNLSWPEQMVKRFPLSAAFLYCGIVIQILLVGWKFSWISRIASAWKRISDFPRNNIGASLKAPKI